MCTLTKFKDIDSSIIIKKLIIIGDLNTPLSIMGKTRHNSSDTYRTFYTTEYAFF